MIEITRHVLITFFTSGNDVISLESRPLNFRVIKHAYSRRRVPVVANTRAKSIRKQIVKYDINTEYPEEYSTVNELK